MRIPDVSKELPQILETRGPPNSDAWQACLAMLLGCSLEEIPSGAAEIMGLLHCLGVQVTHIVAPRQGMPIISGYWLAVGYDEQHVLRACIYRDGQLYRAPHGGSALVSFEWAQVFTLEEACAHS